MNLKNESKKKVEGEMRSKRDHWEALYRFIEANCPVSGAHSVTDMFSVYRITEDICVGITTWDAWTPFICYVDIMWEHNGIVHHHRPITNYQSQNSSLEFAVMKDGFEYAKSFVKDVKERLDASE